MRYRPEHKQRVRRSVLRHAGRLFRKRGFRGTAIDDVMSAARLTRGGFYGHFRSKTELFVEVLRGPYDFIERLRARPAGSDEELRAGAIEVIRGYLHPDHRTKVGEGCNLAALALEITRGPAAGRAAVSEKVDELLDELARGLPAARSRDARAVAALVLCVGGLTLARAVSDEDLACRLLAVSVERAEEELARA